MKKIIIKMVGGIFLVGAVLSISTDVFQKNRSADALFNKAQAGDCESYCPVDGKGCILHYSNDTYVTCTGKWSKAMTEDGDEANLS